MVCSVAPPGRRARKMNKLWFASGDWRVSSGLGRVPWIALLEEAYQSMYAKMSGCHAHNRLVALLPRCSVATSDCSSWIRVCCACSVAVTMYRPKVTAATHTFLPVCASFALGHTSSSSSQSPEWRRVNKMRSCKHSTMWIVNPHHCHRSESHTLSPRKPPSVP
jgi:hypothetical protein